MTRLRDEDERRWAEVVFEKIARKMCISIDFLFHFTLVLFKKPNITFHAKQAHMPVSSSFPFQLKFRLGIISENDFALEVKSSITTMIQHFIYLFCEILTKFAQYYLSLQQSLPS